MQAQTVLATPPAVPNFDVGDCEHTIQSYLDVRVALCLAVAHVVLLTLTFRVVSIKAIRKESPIIYKEWRPIVTCNLKHLRHLSCHRCSRRASRVYMSRR